MKKKPCRLSVLINEHLAAKNQVSRLPKAPELPKSRTGYTNSEWAKYQKDLAEYDFKITQHNEKIASAYDRLEKSRADIEHFLQSRHTWFLTDDKSYAVALQASNWPGDKCRVLYKQKPVVEELPKIELLIID